MTSGSVGYHRTYTLSGGNRLVEEKPASIPAEGSVREELERLRARQQLVNRELDSPRVERVVAETPAEQAGIYPLKVTRFTCSCEGDDEDGVAELLTRRLDNLRVITEVPFMRKGDVVFAIRSQGLLNPHTGHVRSVDALFNGGIFWEGEVDGNTFNYDLFMFRSGRDSFVGRMTESIDLTRKLGDIDPEIYQTEVAFHLDRESNDSEGKPTLSRRLDAYGSPDQIERVARCYGASARFGSAVQGNGGDLRGLAADARNACAVVPGKRYYQAYEAFLQGIIYDPTSPT